MKSLTKIMYTETFSIEQENWEILRLFMDLPESRVTEIDTITKFALSRSLL